VQERPVPATRSLHSAWCPHPPSAPSPTSPHPNLLAAETVYGLGANAFDIEAVLRIFRFKGRPLTDPLIVHVPDAAAAEALIDWPPSSSPLSPPSPSSSPTPDSPLHLVFRTLSSAFWPGPLTLVAKGVASIPEKVMAGTGFVGVRVPANPIAQRLLRAAGVPVAAPSANRFGHVSPTRAAHVVADLGMHPIGVVLSELDGEEGPAAADDALSATAAVGIESTVAKLEEEASPTAGGPRVRVVVLRRGGISMQELRACLDAAGLTDVAVEVRQVAGTTPLPPAAEGPSAAPAAPVAAAAAAAPVAAAAVAEGSASAEVEPDTGEGLEAPGMLLTHYAPDIETVLVVSVSDGSSSGGGTGVAPSLVPVRGNAPAPIDTSRAVVIDFGGSLAGIRSLCLAYVDMSPSASVLEARRALFDRLRWAEDVEGAAAVLLADPLVALAQADDGKREQQHADALRDRMYRASSGKEVGLVLG
jgi:L-threonylcarbamoyladenylate synthase